MKQRWVEFYLIGKSEILIFDWGVGNGIATGEDDFYCQVFFY